MLIFSRQLSSLCVAHALSLLFFVACLLFWQFRLRHSAKDTNLALNGASALPNGTQFCVGGRSPRVAFIISWAFDARAAAALISHRRVWPVVVVVETTNHESICKMNPPSRAAPFDRAKCGLLNQLPAASTLGPDPLIRRICSLVCSNYGTVCACGFGLFYCQFLPASTSPWLNARINIVIII